MTATDPVALTQALIRCRSVTPADDGALGVVETALRAAGFSCKRMPFSEPGTPDIDNLYARRGSQGPNLCFAGHTDIVPVGDLAAWSSAPFEAAVRDGVLYGRGAVDMKGAIACFIAASARYLARTPEPAGSLSFLITGDEEGPSINGTAKMLNQLRAEGERLDACLVGEPSNPSALGDEIKIGRRGSLNVELAVHGVQGHAAYPEKAINPVPKLVHILERLSSAVIDRGTPDFQPSNLEVTVIDVPNTATNVIPSMARAKFNIRYNDLHTRVSIENWVRLQCAAATKGANPGDPPIACYDLAFSGTGEVFRTAPAPGTPAGELVRTLSEAVAAVTGRTPALTTGGGTSDARFIHSHCPVVEFGLVNATIHKVDECVPVTDLEALTAIYERFIEGYFASPTSTP
ncbi:MAG: succinyl-diaminopimelate desuccinylase [Hyphomicrobiaceae bacterium]|nr:succinyl-diaminopimelate desuccinylase [Hyphomicrobiaceae bacterium]